jgi:hypothetical protein
MKDGTSKLLMLIIIYKCIFPYKCSAIMTALAVINHAKVCGIMNIAITAIDMAWSVL